MQALAGKFSMHSEGVSTEMESGLSHPFTTLQVAIALRVSGRAWGGRDPTACIEGFSQKAPAWGHATTEEHIVSVHPPRIRTSALHF